MRIAGTNECSFEYEVFHEPTNLETHQAMVMAD
jgi:hypothetical protein